MTPTPMDPPVYPPIIKLESERGVGKLSLSALLLLACITSTIIRAFTFGNSSHPILLS